METLMGSTIPEGHWKAMEATLRSSMTSQVNELNNLPFTLDIYDMYSAGIKADIISASGKRSTAQSTSTTSNSYVFQFIQFLEPLTSSSSVLTVSVSGNTIRGRTVIDSKLNNNGMTLTFRSTVDITGTLTESYAAAAESIEPQGIDITDVRGNVMENYYGLPGSTVSFNYIIYPEGYDLQYIKRLEWYTNDSDIASVNQDGLVTIHKEGETQLVVWINGDYALSDSIVIIGDKNAKSHATTVSEDGKTEESKTEVRPTAENSAGLPKPKGSEGYPVLDVVEKITAGYSDMVSKVVDFVPETEPLGKVPLLDLLVFSYEVDKDQRENQIFGDSKEQAEKKAFWGNVVGAGPIGAVPKAMDAVLELSKKIGFNFEFSFEKTIKGTSNFLFDMFGSGSNASMEDIKKRHAKNHYGIIGGFGVWVSSTIHDFSNRGIKTREAIDGIE